MEYTKLLGIAVGVAVFCMLLRTLSKEYSTLLSAAFGIFVMGYAVSCAAPYIDFIKGISSDGVSMQCSVILKALSVGLVTTVACDICRSAGENEIAGYSELIGKCAMLSLALPLISGILDAAKELLS